MDKVKFKNLVVNNKKKLVITLAILLISILLISIITYATGNKDYVVEVENDGSDNIAQNSGAPESSVTKKIVSETTKSLTYEVAINNLKTRSSNPEVAVLIDTSSSMSINDIETQVKPKAIEFVRGLLTDVNGVRVSISNNHAVAVGLGGVNTSNCTSYINGLVAGQGSNLADGIDKAISTFSVEDNEKYLIIFSDATDSLVEIDEAGSTSHKLQSAMQNGISVYSILTDMTNSEYKENPDTVGKVQMISDTENFSPIYNKINNSIINVKVKDIFTAETKEYFTLTKATNTPTDVIFTETEDGYELDCANIKAGETKKVQFTLTLDENAQIDSGKVYRILNTSSKMTINYDNYTGDARNYETELSPTYRICQKYSLTIKAVSEKSDKLPVKDLEIKVVGKKIKDAKGNTLEKPINVFDKVLKTNDKGEILIDELKTLGTIEFEIKANVNQIGYSETDATIINVNNRPQKEGITAEADVGEEPVVNNTTRNIEVKLPIKTQTYTINLETVDSTNSNIKLGNIEYRLIQPKLNSKYEMEALYKTTDETGKLTFNPSVMTKDGTYEYILSQLNSQDGYDSIGNVTLYVTFKDGKIVDEQILGKQYGFTHDYNNNVETQRISGTEGKVIVKNQSENADTFRLEINVKDSQNNEKKIQGAIYNVEVTRIASSGQQITNTVNGCITDENGQIKLDLPGTGNVQVKITEVNPATGYHQDTQTKKIVFSRTDGRVQLVTARDPIDLKAEPDSDANALVVNLTSVERSGKNRIQIHMIDNIERDVNIPGVGLTLINLVTNKPYTAVSDGNGIANFLVDDEEPGVYAYDIMLTNDVPYGYISTERKLGGISVHFNDDKFIDECSNTSDEGETIFSPSYEQMDEDFSYHTGKVDIGLTPDAANSYNFQVKLVNDKNQNIQGAKYDITITSGDIVRKITGRATDSNGMITTRLIGTDNIEITVKQTETIKAHIINTQEQIIQLTKVNGIYQITHQEPYIYDGNTQKIGAQISGNNVVYYDVNKEKTGNNTILNLYVNKIDIDNNLVGGVKTVITSPTLKLAGNAITAETNYSATAKSGNVFTLNPAISDNNGYFEIEGIEVNGQELNGGERIDYMYMYEIDANGKKVPNTDITLKLTFRFNENKQIIQITNVEATWGNRLISKRTFDGEETNVAYESNVHLDIYTNYDDVGNFSLDLIKTDKNNNILQGAKYDVIVTRLDGTRVVRRGIEITDSVEFAGLLVAQGTKIEITEVEAPIGYELNEYTEILTITNVEAVTGRITVQLEASGYATPRAELKPVETLVLEDGTYKTCATIKLTDYELATFKFGIKAEDSITANPIEGYKFKVSTSQGAQNNTEPTNTEGKAVAVVGANYEIEGFKVTYTVDTLKVADYYKKLAKPIDIIVVFDLNGEIKTAETIAENEANKATSGYGTLWKIEQTNNTANGGNDIDIKVNIEPEDKLIVNIATQDRRTGEQVTDINYKITPSHNILGEGTTQVEVGYVVPGAKRKYIIESKTENKKYAKLEDQSFTIEYDSDGNIKTVLELSKNITGETHNGKVITLVIKVEPATTVNIISQDRISKEVITTNEYEIAESEYETKGTTKIEVGYAIPKGEKTYTLKQIQDTKGYETLADQTFKIVYDENDNVTNVTDLSDKIVNATFNNGEVTLTLELEPILPVTVNIVTKDAITGNVVYKIQYEVSHIEHHQGEGTTQIKDDKFISGTGSTQAIFECAVPDGTGKYLLKQTNDVNEYVKLSDMEFELQYNDQDEITNAQSNSKKLKIVSFNERTLNVEVTVEPGVPFVISNIGYFDNLPLSNAKFEITSATEITKETTTDVDGKAITYVDKLQENTMVLYKIKQTEAARTYCTVEEFEVEVTFNENREITSAILRDSSDVNKYVTFVTVSHKQPSVQGDLGYNGNDKGIVNIEVKNYPAVQFEITNVDRQNNTKVLVGTNYKVTSSAEETDSATTSPTAKAYVGRGGFSTTVTYTITETSPAARYQKQLIDSVIEVDFDNQGIIRAARIIKNEDITTYSLPGTATYTDSRKVNVQIESNPKLAITINKINENNGKTEPIQGVDFEVIAQIEKENLQNYDEEKLNKIMQDTSTLSEDAYLEEALYRIKQTKDDIQNIKQIIALNKIINDLKENNNLTTDEEDAIMQGIDFSQKANVISNMGKMTMTAIFQTVDNVTIQEVANKLIEDNKTTQDAINDIVAEIKDLVRLDTDRVTTNQNGNATAYMDKTLENKTIEYTLKETKKAEGYDWPKETVRFEVTYDETGKMVQENPIKVISGNFYIQNYNINDFSIETTVLNTPSKEVKIHLTAQDVYDNDKKLETAKFDAFLIDENATNHLGELTYVADNNYRTSLATGSKIISGTTVHGEDTQSIGIYKAAAGTRILRLVEKQAPNTAYIGETKKSIAYKSTPYAMLVRVSFDDEGHVTSASLYNPGGDSKTIGDIVDNRYMTVLWSKNTIEITVKYYPMLKIQMVTQDMYTKQALGASYRVGTSSWAQGYTGENRISSGYINTEGTHGWKFGADYETAYTTDASLPTTGPWTETDLPENLYGASKVAIAPTEAEGSDSRERIFNIFEMSEPTSPTQYQKYRNWYQQYSDQRLIGKFKVVYNEKGELQTATLVRERSTNNITSGFIEITPHIEDDYTVQITVKYAPITTISAKVIDAVSGQGISGIKIEPYQYNTSVSNYPYEYRRTNWYYVTGASGTTGWTYWGGSIADGKVYYQMTTSNYYTRMVGGYFNPGDILLEVSYDDEGRVSAVEVKSTDQFGDPNAIDISWNRNNNNISITIPYQRQFLLDIGKVNYDDSTNKLSGAMFRVESSKGVLTEFNGNSGRHVVGKVYAGKTVRYTITETQYPTNYTSVGTMYVDVEFNNDGTIRKTTSSEPDYYEYVNQISIKDNVSSGMKINIKNKLAFIISLDVRDKFYPTLGVEGATYEITNDKKDNAAGTLITDKNGGISVTVGTIYKNETVKYTIKQKTKANGYYINTQEIEVEVKFNKAGGIDLVSVTKGQDVVTNSGKIIFNSLDAGVFIKTFNMPEDIKVGIEKYDKLDNSVMENIKFNVNVEEVGKVAKDYNLVTNANGTVVDIVDKFAESNDYKKVKYTISEIEVPDSYRKIEDVEIEITYNKDGSMLLYDTISNPSNVEIAVATNKQISVVDGIPTHIKLRIPNDNAYDLVIKNEDRYYSGLGIEGTIYDVTINGEQIKPAPTNTYGYTRISDRTEVGNIEIKITERTPGEGYREEPENTTTIVLNKGTNVYSLALDPINGNSNPTYAIVTVDEDHGIVTVVFKNETKLELNIIKDDINTESLLEGAIFAITSEELNNSNNPIDGTLKTITNTKVTEEVKDKDGNIIKKIYHVDDAEQTNKDGLINLDLGLAYQNKTIRYTLEEVVVPEGYTPIVPIKVTVQFDQYGRIMQITDDSFRAKCYLDSNTGKSHNMIFNISNGTVDPEYTVKIVSQDSQTGTRINGSIFQVEIKDSEEETYKNVTGTTRDVTKTVGRNTFIAEKGVMKVTGIKAEGDITIALNQIETATGYVYGSNKVTGNVIANAEFIVSASELEKDVKLEVTDNGGFEVLVDNTNREITIKVKNDPELTFDITKINGKTKEKLSGAEFKVTSIVQTSATTTPTTLNEKSPLTDENGHTTLNGGIIQAGRTMIYTLKENTLEGYEQLEDIVILVQYDTKGNILYYEILSDVNDVRVIKDVVQTDENGNPVKDEQGNLVFKEEAKILETKRVLGESDIPGIVEAEYQTYKVPTGIGTKKLQLEVSNTPESPNNEDGYQVIIDKLHIDDISYHIPGVTFEIKVTQEYGKAQTTWIDTTDNTGIIKSPYFYGYGYITVEIKEIATIDGLKLDAATKSITFIRNKETHKMELVNVNPINIGYSFEEGDTKVRLMPVNEIASNMYNMMINKVDKNTDMLITNNSAEFEIYRVEQYENIKEIQNDETGEVTYESEIQEIRQLIVKETTGETGRIMANNLRAPEEGTYKYVIKETKAPEGYILPAEEMELEITFAKNEADELIMTNVEVTKGHDKLKIAKAKAQLLNLIILNTNEKDVTQDGEYKFNIVKVDNEKNPITTDKAIFKLTNMQTNEVNYYETNEQGKLEIPTFKMPEEEGMYNYKLNEVKAPNGYVLNVNDIMLELEFAKDEEGKMYLKDVQVQGDNIEYQSPEEGSLPDTTITIKVTNEKGGAGTGNVNDKRYTLVLNKVDSETKEIITEHVEFEVILANGEIVKGNTNSNGQLKIEDVFMPAEPGEYELIIKEVTNPSGYKVDNEPKNVKVTFTGYGPNMVISDIELGDTNNKNIEILQDKCSEQYVEVNILNEKENPELYVISKRDEADNDIYDVLKGYDVAKKHYKIDKPFIDTKVAKYGSNVTVQQFIDNLESNGHMVVLDKDGKEVAQTARVKTGMTLQSTLGNQKLTFTIIVKGDANGDGRVTTVDLNMLTNHLIGEKVITDPIKLRALDLSNDGRITTVDLNKMYQVNVS